MNKILVTGAKGQLGSELQALVGEDKRYHFISREDVDLSDAKALKTFLQQQQYDLIINCAAYTAVDLAETEEQKAYAINEKAVGILAEYAKSQHAKLIHISTDYVFNGKNYRPYLESDDVAPQNVYGKSKLQGEQLLQQINPENSIIIRTSWVYSSFGANFVKTMLRLGRERDELGIIFDQVGTPTYAKDLAEAILSIAPKIDNKHVEIYHYSNEGVCSWYDFAKAIFEMNQIECQVNPIETSAYPTPALRPHYSLLNKLKIKERYSIEIPYWKDSLKMCLETLQKEQNV